jgi:hypothetical protein
VLAVVTLFLGDLPRRTLAFAVAGALILAGVVWGGLRIRRMYVEWRLWQAAVSHQVTWLHDQFQWHVLRDVTHEAEVWDWDVGIIGDSKGIGMTSPDGVYVYVEPSLMHTETLAERLHEASPEHFRDKWMPSVTRAVVDNKIELKDLTKRFEETEKTVKQLRHAPKGARILREAFERSDQDRRLEEMHAKASELGWSIERKDTQYVFTRGSEKEVAPLSMEPKLIIDRLRQRDR